jgi:hypothetical protein
MASTFEVHGALAISERGLFGLTGEIGSGTVQTGMLASLATDSSPLFRERVHSVEYLDLPEARGKPTLTFHYRDPVKLSRWMAIEWTGQTLSLSY